MGMIPSFRCLVWFCFVCFVTSFKYRSTSFISKKCLRLHMTASVVKQSEAITASTEASRAPSKKIQALDFTSLFIAVNELRNHVLPGKVETVVQEDNFNVYISVRTADQNHWVQLSWHPSLARIGLGIPPPKVEPYPFSFASTLRVLLNGLTITGIAILAPYERIVVLEFSERLTDTTPKWKLILEIMGTRSNAVLVAGDSNIIQSCAYQVSSSITVRPLQTSIKYFPPPIGGGIYEPLFPADECSSFELFNKHFKTFENVTIDKALIACYRGLSPNIAKAIIEHANITQTLYVGSLSQDQLQLLHNYVRVWSQIFATSNALQPTSLSTNTLALKIQPMTLGNGQYTPITFGDRHDFCEHNNEHNNVQHSSLLSRSIILTYLRHFYGKLSRDMEFDMLKNSCQKKLMIKMTKGFRLRDDFEQPLEEGTGSEPDRLKDLADLITAFIHSWDGKSCTLDCYTFEEQESVQVVLPKKKDTNIIITPMEHAQDLYKKAKKLRRSVAIYNLLLSQIKLHIGYLEEIESSLSTFETYTSYDDILALREISDELDNINEAAVVSAAAVNDFSDGGSEAINTLEISKKEQKEEKQQQTNKKSSKSKAKEKLSTISKGKAESKTSKSNANKNTNKNTIKDKSVNKAARTSNRKKLLQGLLVLESPHNTQGIPQGNEKDDDNDVLITFPPLVVGRNSKQNDKITFEIAKEHNLWFHVQGSPGSHCLLQLDPGELPSTEALQFACDVASYYSKARGSTQVPVVYCSPKYLKRITGGAPGMVSILQQQGVMYGRPLRGLEWIKKLGPSDFPGAVV